MSDGKDIKGKLSNVARKYVHLVICPREVKLIVENRILSEQPNQNCLIELLLLAFKPKDNFPNTLNKI